MIADDAHLSIDQLADLSADATPADEASSAQAHLRTCERCRGTYDLLAGLPALLASVEAPPMPADVTARVVAAIERAQIARTDEAENLRSLDAARSRPQRAGVRGRLGTRIGAGLLGAAAVLGGGYLVLSGTLFDLGGEDSAETSAGAVQDSAEVSEEDMGLAPSAAEAPLDDDLLMAYTAESLDEDVQALLASEEVDTTSRQPEVIGEDGAIGEPDDAAVKACISATQRRAGSGADPLAVDFSSTYEGEPAVVVVLPDGSNAVDVWVLGRTSCVAAESYAATEGASKLDVLQRATVPR